MREIKLRKGVWKYDPNSPLGPPGGFGVVFIGYDNNNQEVAVKKLHISSSSTGHRELVVSEELSNLDVGTLLNLSTCYLPDSAL